MDGMGRGMTGMIAVLSLALSACAQPAAPTAVPASPQPSSATVQGAPATTLAGTTPAATTRCEPLRVMLIAEALSLAKADVAPAKGGIHSGWPLPSRPWQEAQRVA